MAGLMSQHIGGSSTTIPQSGLLAQQPVGLLQGFPTYTGPERKPVATKPPRLKYEQDRLRAMIQQQKMAELMSQNIGGGSTPQEGLMPRQPMGSMQGFPPDTGPEQSALFFNASKGYEPVAYNPPRLITPLSIQKYEQEQQAPLISGDTNGTLSFIADQELGEHDRKTLQGKPYLSSKVAQRTGISGKARSLSHIGEVSAGSGGSKTQATIGFGHDITPDELSKGTIHGVKFMNPDGSFLDLSKEALSIIFKKDIEKHTEGAEKQFNRQQIGLKFKELPVEMRDFLSDRAFNMGSSEDEANRKDYPKAAKALKSAMASSISKASGNNVSINKITKHVEDFIKEIKQRGGAQSRSDKFVDFLKLKGVMVKYILDKLKR
jgi:hypothetical protein